MIWDRLCGCRGGLRGSKIGEFTGEKAPFVWLSASWLLVSSRLCGEVLFDPLLDVGLLAVSCVFPRTTEGLASAARLRGVLRETFVSAARSSTEHCRDAFFAVANDVFQSPTVAFWILRLAEASPRAIH